MKPMEVNISKLIILHLDFNSLQVYIIHMLLPDFSNQQCSQPAHNRGRDSISLPFKSISLKI